MIRPTFIAVGLAAYILFLATFLYLIAFVAGLPIVPRSIDHPVVVAATSSSLAVDLALVAIFGIQHTVMARPRFKQAWTKVVPEPIERSAYLIVTCAALLLMFACWQPVPGRFWDARGTLGEPILWVVFGAGWLIVLISTFLINHGELFGLKQVWDHWRGQSPAAPIFHQPLFYKLVRHPLYSGFLLAFWAAPLMTIGHAVFAGAMTFYILIAIEFEERDLTRAFGSDYTVYRRTVGKLIPRLGARRPR